MKRMVGALALVMLAAGCGNLSAVLNIFGFSPNEVTLRLVNETAFRVDPNVYVSAIEGFGFDALTEELLALDINLEDFGELGPGAELTRTYDCDDIGAALVDADTLLVDDGAGGTQKKTAMSRVWTYIVTAIQALSAKTTPVDADILTIQDTEDSNDLKELTVGNLWDNRYLTDAKAIKLPLTIPCDAPSMMA